MKTKIYIILVSFLFISCAGLRKKKAYRYFNENKTELAELCKERFPISETYIKGDTIRITDTIKRIDKELVFVDCPDGTKKECPPKETKYIKEKILVTDTVVKIDTRENFILKDKIEKLEKERDRKSKKSEYLTYLSIILLSVIVIQRILR